jgi:hypothetical protein
MRAVVANSIPRSRSFASTTEPIFTKLLHAVTRGDGLLPIGSAHKGGNAGTDVNLPVPGALTKLQGGASIGTWRKTDRC